ncbi:uncharacterized protein VP01_3991g1 [Puccinia sorghi]|uniref:DDE Tnp4 domain-containing protein n=1 Tax=Puccinia sorghi TaxID=27349 RepID=A0A0L6US42_9BASI|nr:uncharacterized protein VP01_3991g1 [Puccinia sorghi]
MLESPTGALFQRILVDGCLVLVEEKVLLFLDIVVNKNLMGQTAVNFQPDTIFTPSDSFMLLFPPIMLPKRLQDPKYNAFKNCLGAMEGVLILVSVLLTQQAPYRPCKGFLTQNFLAVVSFDFNILYVLAGWEGSAHDATVLVDTFCKNLTIPRKKKLITSERAICGMVEAPESQITLQLASFFSLQCYTYNSLQTQHLPTLNNNNFLIAEDENFENPTSVSDPQPHTHAATKDASMASRCMRLSDKLWNQYQSYLASNPQ